MDIDFRSIRINEGFENGSDFFYYPCINEVNIFGEIPLIYLDLQDRVDRNKLTEPALFFDRHRNKLICLDEIRRLPAFLPMLQKDYTPNKGIRI